MSLQDVMTFAIARESIDATAEALREAGQEGYERFVLWSGVVASREFAVQCVHVPRQRSYKTCEGLVVRVDGPELHRLNVWLYEHGQRFGVQVHAHPTDAFHSRTDDDYPIVCEEGALSVVVPNFCRDDVISHGTAYFRLHDGTWQQTASTCMRVL